MKQAKLNSTMLLSKYENMLDVLDLNSVAKIRLSLLSLPTLNYKHLVIISFLLLRAFCAAVWLKLYI